MMPFANILVPTDFGAAARRAADVACDLAAGTRARVTLLHVWTVPMPAYSERIALPLEEIQREGQRVLGGEAERIRGRCSEVKTLFLNGVAWRLIVDAVEENRFDLVVLGTHGRRGLDHLLLGSVAEKVVRACPVPVLTVHAPPGATENAISNRDPG